MKRGKYWRLRELCRFLSARDNNEKIGLSQIITRRYYQCIKSHPYHKPHWRNKSCTNLARSLISQVYLLIRLATRHYGESIDSICTSFISLFQLPLRRFAKKQVRVFKTLAEMETHRNVCPCCQGRGLLLYTDYLNYSANQLRKILLNMVSDTKHLSWYEPVTSAFIASLAGVLFKDNESHRTQAVFHLQTLYNSNPKKYYYLKDIIKFLRSLKGRS
jgi:hypothetical protein